MLRPRSTRTTVGHLATLLVVANASVNHVTAEASSRLESRVGILADVPVLGARILARAYRIHHQVVITAPAICPRALSIIQGRAVGVAHYLLGGIVTTWAFFLARALGVS